MSDGESTTIEAEEDEYPLKIIPEEDDEDALADLYMLPNEAASAASIQVNDGWVKVCQENRFCIKGPVYFAFPTNYELVLTATSSRVTDFPAGHVAIYTHMLDFGLCFSLDLFIVKIFEAWNICLAQLTLLGWWNLIAYA